ncbi:RNA polymerase sigma-70 factor [Chitinophaga sp. SYP-B3965]|uniref:RNA polymerase sigma factor n=1 Tax=Chitinophaga sp. SYP-B3965 TaxID=2663120 RepID=UPI001299B9FF|nr:RNA polymerase sigma-70 factor [Chitinophaga sp. SYP-B3965]MRG47205.1 RNA polymerase sigma-70 factor [Chitinophaga sp. SYP-B3965]
MSNNQPNIDQELLFMDIFRKHEGRLYALALKLTKSAPHAQDIIQEVFLKLWEQREDIRQIRNMEAWLYRITENKVIDFLRKAAADDRLREAIWNNLPQNSNATETVVIAHEYEHILQKAISLLPPQRKLIYCLNREAGMNYQEIASELHISRHTVKNQLSTALQTIRSFVSKTTGPLTIFLLNFF